MDGKGSKDQEGKGDKFLSQKRKSKSPSLSPNGKFSIAPAKQYKYDLTFALTAGSRSL